MTNPLSLKDVELKFEEVMNRAKTAQVKSNLEDIQSTLRKLTSKGINPSISSLVKHLNKKGPSISLQTFYNSRPLGNLYRELYDAWESHWKIPKNTIRPELSDYFPGSAQVLTVDDLKEINDPVLKYRVKFMLSEFNNLKKQMNILRSEIVQSPILLKYDTVTKKQSLTVEDAELIQKFLNNNFDTEFNETGALVVKHNIRKGSAISDPGLKQTIFKLL